MPDKPLVSVIIVSFNTRELLLRCLEPLDGQDGLIEAIVVDNASSDGSAEALEGRWPWCRVVRAGWNRGFGAANNLAFNLARGQNFLLLNPDALVSRADILTCANRLAQTPSAGAAGGLIIDEEGRPQPSARRFPTWLGDMKTAMGRGDDSSIPEGSVIADWTPGAFLMFKQDVLKRVGRFDEDFFMYYEEVDLCLRMRRAGLNLVVWPDLRIRHVGGACAKTVTGGEITETGSMLSGWRARSRLLYYRKNGGPGAALAAHLTEEWWNRLRAWRNSRREGAQAAMKAAASRAAVDAERKAWVDTKGGRQCPAKPW